MENWGDGHFVRGDIANVRAEQLPGEADLAWAAFPCQDLSLAGDYKGLGEAGCVANSANTKLSPFPEESMSDFRRSWLRDRRQSA